MHPLDLLFPKLCLGCGKMGAYICPKCTKTVRMLSENETICPVCRKAAYLGITHPYCRGRGKADGSASFFRYEGIVRKAVKAVKFRYAADILEHLCDLIPLTSYNNISNWPGINRSLIIPIPLSLTRFRLRGFNQAEYFAGRLAKQLGLEVCVDVLFRLKHTTPQTEMKTREMRLCNVKDMFAVRKEALGLVKNRCLLVADDVSTTGATLNEAAKSLKSAGVKTVYEVSLAR